MSEDRFDVASVRQQVHEHMGGTEKVQALRVAGRRTARDFTSAFFDAGSFRELGTFAGMGVDQPPTAAGDGRIAGHGMVAGDAVGVIIDDVTVKRASSTTLNARKAERVVRLAQRTGMPVLFVGEAGGARLPETLRGDVFASEPIYPWLFDPAKPPLITAIVGDSYGGSSFVAAMSDIVVMLQGSVLALTSPRVIGIATGAQVTAEALGGAEVVAAKTDLVDIVVEDVDALDAVLHQALRFFTCRHDEARRGPDVDLRSLVPEQDSKVYDIVAVVNAILDEDSFLETGAFRGRSVVTGLGRIDGRVVGVIASQPLREAGALSPDACEKAARMTALCNRFGFPIVCLVDTPGFQIGVEVEHSGMLRAAMDLIESNTAATCPTVTVILRKAFGLAFFAMFSPAHGGDVVLSWPNAHIGFMAPAVAANVLYGDELDGLEPTERKTRLGERAESLGASSTARDVAAAMGVDEIIDESDTVPAIRRYLDLVCG